MRTRSTILGFATLIVLLTAGAAQSLSGSNTVFSDDIVDGTITTPDLKTGALSGSKILDNSVTGTDINESTIPGFKKVFFSRVSSLGTQIGGNATSVSRPATGTYNVTFPFPVGQCASTATVASFSDNPLGNTFQAGNIAAVDVSSGTPNVAQVVIITNAGAFANLSFALVVVCP